MSNQDDEDGRRRRLRGAGAGSGATSITDLAKRGPFGKTFLYAQISAGRLKARKAGGATVVLDEDWRSFLESLPIIGEAA